MHPTEGIVQLEKRLAVLAPSLRLQPMPKLPHTTGNKSVHGIDVLLQLCATVEQKEEVVELVSKFNKDPDTQEVAILGAFDAKTNAFNLTKAIYLNEQSMLVHNFVGLIEMHVEDPASVKDTLEFFLTSNGHDAFALPIAEECLSVAYALHTLLRAFPTIPFAIQGTLVNITESTEVLPLFLPLFTESTKPKKSPTKKPTDNKKKRKMRS
ncbi:hypothetical protein THRCLA_05984 [Thraustotheca clavata]|uniref:Uncharacterized protein n=1 Tax=Thraustotheca clavata TaxID=74557 RepID=A0A1V9ZQS1_9STRA|nr:hypothetical protein THRCLA_05984 [Thraustotheca clavata]